MTRLMQRQTRQDTTIKSLETSQQAGGTCFTRILTFNCGQLAVSGILCRQKCNKKRAWAQAGSVLLSEELQSKSQDLHWPQTQQWEFSQRSSCWRRHCRARWWDGRFSCQNGCWLLSKGCLNLSPTKPLPVLLQNLAWLSVSFPEKTAALSPPFHVIGRLSNHM